MIINFVDLDYIDYLLSAVIKFGGFIVALIKNVKF